MLKWTFFSRRFIKIARATTIALSVFILVGCAQQDRNNSTKGNKTNTDQTEQSQQTQSSKDKNNDSETKDISNVAPDAPANAPGPYKIITSDDLAPEVDTWFSTYGNQKGAYVYQHPYGIYIKINAGERSTGGYSMRIDEFSGEYYDKTIVAELVAPAKHAMVTQAVTYPEMILNVSSDNIAYYSIKLKLADDTQALELKEKTYLAAIEQPKKAEIIKSPVRIKGKIAAFEGAFIIRILDGDGGILIEKNMQTDGAPTWGGFDTEISFPSSSKTESDKKGSIEVGEYSAEDGAYKVHAKVDVVF